MDLKIVSVYSRKGGTGKTTISYHLAKTLTNCFYMTNDDDGGETIIEQLGEDKASLVKNEIDNSFNYLIYDGGGFVDKMSLNFLLNSDSIIIPTNLENRSLRSTRKLIDELIESHRVDKSKIIIVINKYKKSDKPEEEKELISSIFEEIENIIFLRDTKILENMIDENKSFKEYSLKYPIFKKFTSKLEDEFNEIIKLVK